VLAELAACYRNILGAFLTSDCHTLRLAPIELPSAIVNRSSSKSSKNSNDSAWSKAACESLVGEWPRLTLEALRLGYAQLAPRDRAALYSSSNDAYRAKSNHNSNTRHGGVGILNGSILGNSTPADRNNTGSSSGDGRQVDLCLVDPSQVDAYRVAGFAESREAVAARQAFLEKEKQARQQAAKAANAKAKADEKARIAAAKAEKKASAKELKAKAAAAKKDNGGGNGSTGGGVSNGGNAGDSRSGQKGATSLPSSADTRPASSSGAGNTSWFGGRMRRISGENSDASGSGGSGGGNSGGWFSGSRSGSNGEGVLVSPEAVAAGRASRFAALVELRRSCGLGEELEESLSSSTSSSSSSSSSSSASSGKTSNSASTSSSLVGASLSSSSSRHPVHASSLVVPDSSTHGSNNSSNASSPVSTAAAPLSIEDMHVRVVCRVRPENTVERERSGGGAVKILSANEVEVLAPVDSQSGAAGGGDGTEDAPAENKKDSKAGNGGKSDSSKPHRDAKASKSRGRRNASFTEGTSFAPVAAASNGIAANAPALGQRQAHRFTFDRVLGPSSTQQECYEAAAAPVISTFLTGYNCTIFAYGQTASGKVLY